MKVLKSKIKEYLYIIFISISIIDILFCFIFWYFFPDFYNNYKGVFVFLKGLSTTTLGAGVFTAMLKYFQFMGIYKDEINNIISSSEFENKLTKVIQNNPYNIDSLKGRNDINQIWKNATLCLFESEYPQISEKIKNKLSNSFFDGDSLAHYYKNYVIQLDITFDNTTNLISIKETSSFTIVRPNSDSFNYHFEYLMDLKNIDDNETKYELESFKVNNTDIEMNENPVCIVEYPSKCSKEFQQKFNFEGNIEYHIHHVINLIYDIDIDNKYSFDCTKAIDNINFSFTLSDNLGYNISTINFDNFLTIRNNGTTFALDYREIILPNSGIKLFFYKK